MLSLSIVFLAVAIALWAQPASAEDICPFGNLTQEELSLNTPGEHYNAANCTFISNVYLYVTDIPANTSAIQVTVENSVVSEGSVLFVNFDSCDNYYDENGEFHTAPVALTIKKNLFQLNSVFYFYGCLPPNSTVTFQSNVMSANRSNNYLETSSIHFVYFYQAYTISGTSFNILDNTMSALDVTDERSIQGVYSYGFYLYANSSVNIQRNTITVNGSVYGAIVQISDLDVGSNSTFRIEDNTMTSNTTLYTVEAIYLYSVYGDPSGLVSISRNLLSIQSGRYTDDYVMLLYYFQYVSLLLDNNDISYNYDSFLYVYAVYQPSSVSISGNALDYTNATATAPFISIGEYYFANSTATIANNKVTGPSVFTNTSLFLQVNSVSNESASIVHCGNTLPWAASPTAEQFVSAELIPLLVYDADVCTVATTETTTTLVATFTSVTTTASGGTTTVQNMTTLDAGATTSVTTRSTTPAKSASAAAYLGHAAVACLFAVAASLL